MKKKLFFMIACLLGTTYGWANPVTVEEARQKAGLFVNNRVAAHARAAVKAKSENWDIQSQLKMVSVGDEQSYYIFNVGQNEGYVVVSGDDATDEILGYCDSGSIIPDQMPCNMKAWMEGYAEQIKFIRKKGIKKAENEISFTGHYELEGRLAKWGQGLPFNYLCPSIDGKHCLTGCVATAMAQIMYYHRWPEKPVRDIPGYVSKRNSLNVNSVNSSVNFLWDNILPDYTGYESLSNDNNNSVALLMLDAGTAVHMDYGPSVSLANDRQAAYALSHYFGFNPQIFIAGKQEYTTEDEWLQLIYNELQHGPVYFGAEDPDYEDEDGNKGAGHAFLVEGIDGDMLKINWGWSGWSGYCEASPDAPWFRSSLLNCKTQIGDLYNFYEGHTILTHVEPNKSGDYPEMPLYLSWSYCDYANGNTGLFTRYQGIRLKVQFRNCTPIGSTFDYGVGIIDLDGNPVGDFVTIGTTPFLEPLDYYPAKENNEEIDPTIEIKLPIDSDCPDGKYYLFFTSKATGSENYAVDPRWGKIISITLDGNKVILGHEDDEETVNLKVNTLVIDHGSLVDKVILGTTLSGWVAVENNDTANYSGNITIGVFDETTETYKEKQQNVTIAGMAERKFDFSFSGLDTGHSYHIYVEHGYTNEIYRSSSLICQEDGYAELQVGSFFTEKTREGIELNFRVVNNFPRQVEIRSTSGDDWVAAVSQDVEGRLTIPTTVRGYTVTRIGNFAFYDCGNLTSVYIPSTVTIIGRAAFCDCVDINRIDGMDQVTAIGAIAFKNCDSMKEFNLPNTLTTIYTQAFSDCDALESFTLPASVTNLEPSGSNSYKLFVDCKNLTSITVEEGNPVYDSRSGCNAIIVTATNMLYTGCKTSTIPEGIAAIGDYAFGSVNGLGKIVIPASVESVGVRAFYYCNDLDTVKVNATVPPAVSSNSFSNAGSIVLLVPEGSKSQYANDEVWGAFRTIREVGSYDDKPVESLDGLNFVVWIDYGGVVGYPLGDRPRLSLKNGKVVITTNQTQTTFLPADVARVTIEGSKQQYGDANGDEVVNNADVDVIVDYLGGRSTGVTRGMADVNGDGMVDISDILCVLRKMTSK